MKKNKYIYTILILLISFAVFSGCENFLMEEYELDVNIEGEGTVNVQLAGQTFTEDDTILILEDETVSLEPVADNNWNFEKWTGPDADDIKEDDGWNLVMDSDKSITAKFVKNEIDINTSLEDIDLKVDESQEVTVSTEPEADDVNYSIDDDNVAEINETADGFKVDAVAPGTAELTITATKDNYFEAEKTINITVDKADMDITVSPQTIEDLEQGDTEEITITTDPDNVSLDFSYDDSIIDFDEDTYTITALETGTTTLKITASKAGYNEEEKNISVSVIDPVLEDIDLNVVQEELNLEIGDEDTLDYTVDPDDASLVFESDDDSVVTVNDTGAVEAIGEGSTTITVTANKDGYNEASVNIPVTVSKKQFETLTVTPDIIEIEEGETADLNVETVPEDEVEISFKSDDTDIAEVSDTGTVTAQTAGTTKIIVTASKENYEDKTAEIEVKILDEFDLTVNIDGEGTVSTNPDEDTYTEGAKVILLPEPADGHEFKEWAGPDGDDVAYSSVSEKYIIKMHADKEITAVFEDFSKAAKTFVNNIKTHGVNLQNLGQDQAEKIEQNMTQELIPYSVSAGYRLGYFGKVLLAWRHMIYQDGEFTIDLDKFDSTFDPDQTNRDEWIIEKPDESYVPSDDGLWEWTINLAGRDEQIVIKSTAGPVILEDEEIDGQTIRNIDFSNAEFVYEHYFGVGEGDDPSSNDDWAPDWQFDFDMNSEHQDVYVTQDFVWNTFDELRITYPQDPVFNIQQAKLEDELEIVDYQNVLQNILGPEEDSDLPPIGTLTIDGILDLGHNDDGVLLDGTLSSEVIDIDGLIEMTFYNRPPLEEIVNGQSFPQLESITINELYETSTFKIEGNTSIDFIIKDFVLEDGSSGTISLPDLVEFDGLYRDQIAEDGFSHDGSLTIDPDYSEYVIDLSNGNIEDPDNYVTGYIELIGDMVNTGFEDVNMDLTLERTDYQAVAADFRYDFAVDKYIEGTASIDIANKEFNLQANNEQGLEMTMTITPEDIKNSIDNPDTPQTVGEIVSDDKMIGEIIILDGMLSVQFLDGKIVSLLPEANPEQ